MDGRVLNTAESKVGKTPLHNSRTIHHSSKRRPTSGASGGRKPTWFSAERLILNAGQAFELVCARAVHFSVVTGSYCLTPTRSFGSKHFGFSFVRARCILPRPLLARPRWCGGKPKPVSPPTCTPGGALSNAGV